MSTRAAAALPRGEGLSHALLALFVGISAVGPVALNGVLPATSALMTELGTSYGLAQLVLTVYLAATLASQVVLGPMADRRGRRPVMIGSLVVFGVGSAGCALAPNIELLLVARFVQGFGGAVCMFLPRTIVRDVYPRDRAASVIGYMTTAMMVAPMFGPALGGWVTDVASWRWMYWGLAVFGLALAAIAARAQPETLGRVDEGGTAVVGSHRVAVAEAPPRRAPFATLLGERAFVAYTLMMTGTVGVYYAFLAGAPYVAMESRGLEASTYGKWFAMVAIGYLTGNLIAGRFSERVGVNRMIRLGFVPFALGIVLFWALAGWSHPFGLFLPMQLVALSNGMSLPNMISGAMSVRPTLAASASGLAGGVQTAFGVLLTLVVGWVLPSGDAWLAVIVTCSGTLAAFGLWIANGSSAASPPSGRTEVAAISAGRR